ncbi:MAG: SPFH domain-containing protein [Sulfurovaceae bacterium]|jgi:regulator of protease activity HflC (stomatin/prohibitin superfamily)
MPTDMNDYFKKKKPASNNQSNTGGGDNKGGGNSGGGFNMPPMGGSPKILQGVIVAVVLIFLFFILKPFTIINSGEVGIKVRTGKFDNTPLQPGLHFYIPVFERILPVNTRIRLIVYSNLERDTIGDNYAKSSLSSETFEGGLKKNPSIQVLDKRGLTVNIDIAVQYQLRAESAALTIEKWGAGWEEKIINSQVREVVRDVVGQYTAEQLPEMRNEIAAAITTKISQKITSLEGTPVVLSSVELRNIDLPQKIKDQIERVQIAKQEVTIAEQQKEQAKQEALKKAEIAKGEAERNRIEAQGQADKIRIEAEEQAKANILISKSLSDKLLQLEQIKTQAKFNEALKENRDAQIFLTPGGAVPNIWLDSKDKKRSTATGN